MPPKSTKKTAESKSTAKPITSIDSDDGIVETPTKKPKATPAKAAPAKVSTPVAKKTAKTESKANTSAIEEKKSPVKRAKTETDFRTLPTSGDTNNAVVVQFDSSPNAKQSKAGFTHSIKLSASDSFKLLSTTTVTEGQFKGRQVIVIETSQPLEILKFTAEIREKIYEAYFACKGVYNDPIPLESKRKGSGDLWSKAYADGSKHRVALLAVNKQIHREALPVLYAKAIRVAEPTSLLNFLGVLPEPLSHRLRQIKIVQYKSANTKTAMNFLGRAKNIVRLEIENGVATAAEPAKAAEAFYAEIRVLVDAITATLKERASTATKLDALKVIELGKDALAFKDKDYTKEEREEFFETLRAKVK